MNNKSKILSNALNVQVALSPEMRRAVKSFATIVDWCWKTTSSTKGLNGVSFHPNKATNVLELVRP